MLITVVSHESAEAREEAVAVCLEGLRITIEILTHTFYAYFILS
jgi:hypothetical protein